MTKARDRAIGSFTTTAVSSNITLVPFTNYMVDTTTTRSLTLPAAPNTGDEIHIFDVSGQAGTNNITVNNNGLKVAGNLQSLVIDKNYAAAVLVYTGSTYGWRVS